MTTCNVTITVTNEAPFKEVCDEINRLSAGDVKATWNECIDDMVEVHIDGSSDGELIMEQIHILIGK